MQQLTEKTKNYANVLKHQKIILEELDQLKNKIRFLGSLNRFKEVAKRGRRFAKKQQIRSKDILADD